MSGSCRFNRYSIVTRLMLGTALTSAAVIGAVAQPAQDTETVISTGTSIRGVAPTGTNLITVDQLEQETIYGVAAVLWPFATKATQQRLQKKLDTIAASPAVKRARATAAR